MKQVLLFLAVVISFNSSFSQVSMPLGGGGKAPSAPKIGRVYGKIVDSSGKGIRDASVLLLQSKLDTATKKMKEVLIKGTSTQANGDFNMEELPIMGQFRLEVSATGFEPVSQSVSFMPSPGAAQGGNVVKPAPGQMPDMSKMAANFEKDLDKIFLKTDFKQLEAVTVTGSTGRLRMDIDKKVFNVDQNIVSAGGTAVDVMKNVPSVNVDIDGNVTVRNASPQIYVDGRPTTLSLDQIPADAIESVEVITNPSAKFDASGGNAGILNIVLKKNKKKGYNGNVMAGVDKRGGINGGGSFSLRQDKFNFTISAFGNQMRNRNTGETNITNLLQSPSLLVNQNSSNRMNGGFLFGRASVDYFATNRTTLSLGVVRVHGSFNPKDLLKTDSALSNGEYLSYSERNTRNEREFNAVGLNGGLKYLFPKKGEELTADFNFFNGKNESSSHYNTDIFASQGGVKNGNIQQQILGSGKNQFLTVQTDYVRPFGKSGKIETGARVQLRSMENNQGNYYFDDVNGVFKPVPSASANYKNSDNVYAAYLSMSNSIKNFGYQLGLRAESSNYEGELTDTKQKFSNNYAISLFPSVFLSQKLSNQQELQMSYTRRINRPFFMQVIPFIDSTDQLNWSRGNANLKPEFTNSIEVSYSKSLPKNNTIMASVYYKYSTDLITRYLDTISVGNNVERPISTYINANSSRSMGVELTSQNTITKWWDMNTNVNLYNAKINADNIKGANQDARWSWFAKMNSNFKLPSNFKIQLSGTYQSKTNQTVSSGGNFGPGGGSMGGGSQSAAQGYIRANYGVDLALQKSFLKNNAASVTLSMSDIFRTRKFGMYSETGYFIQETSRLMDSPMFRLNFSFRFGQMDLSVLKRKNMKAESEGTQGAMQGMGG